MLYSKKNWLTFTEKFGFSILHPQYLAKRHTLWFIKKTLKYTKGNLIDVGCGTKPYKKYYIQQVKSYTGMDHPITAKMYPTNNKPEIFGDILNIPLKKDSFDTAILFEVLEHISNPNKAISEVARILKKGGYLLVTVPFFYPLHDTPHDYLRYTEFYLKKLFNQNGLKLVKLYSIGNFWSFWIQSLILNILFYTLKSIKSITLGKTILLLILLPIFVPFYLLSNLLFSLLNPVGKNPKSPKLFPSEYLLIIRKT